MSYNNSYNTRNSGRYNTPGRFVSGGELAPGGPVGSGPRHNRNFNGNNYQQRPYQQYNRQNQQQQQSPQQPPPQQTPPAPAAPVAPSAVLQPTEQQNLMLQNWDVEMNAENTDSAKESEAKPHWMKSRLSGVKKITNKERRRRQNENLRRLLAPKNALMVLNEMMPAERDAAQFKVEPSASPFVSEANSHIFCAELTIDGINYKGYGDNKIAARNDAAEQAIRDLIIKRMAKANNMEVNQGQSGEGEKTGEEEEEAPLPMIQLASFALHKLFAEWECDGHKVPQLKPTANPSQANDASSEASGPAGGAGGAAGAGGAGGGARAKPPRALPAGAAAMHPCMLLTYMRPHLEYRELAVEGDRPQNMLFTMGIDVDGATYIGKAANKREARKKAARAACEALFGVAFEDAPPAAAAAADVKPEIEA